MNRLVFVVLLFAALQVYASPASKSAWDLAEPLKEDDNDMTPEPTEATEKDLAHSPSKKEDEKYGEDMNEVKELQYPYKEHDKDGDDKNEEDVVELQYPYKEHDKDGDDKNEEDIVELQYPYKEQDKDDNKDKIIADKDELEDLAGEGEQESEGDDSPLYGHGPDIVEGDIKLSPEQAALFKTGGWNALAGSEAWAAGHGRWSRTIPYVIDSNIHSSVRRAISYSIGLFHRYTCLRFVRRQSYNRNYIRFVDRGGCWSYIGRITSGAQLVSVSRGCVRAIPAHELLHALGRWHEQSRPDRNRYVTINFGNVIRGQEHNFRIQANSDVQSVPYDYVSVMHYSAYAFSRNRRPTIAPRRSCVILGQINGLSARDILHTNIRYCPDRAVRLVGGRGSYEGRVEVFWNGQWGTVCDDDFGRNDARTICKYLGFPDAVSSYRRAHFGRGTGPIWFDNMHCTGNEYSPFSCRKNAIGSHNCGHREDAGVRCQKNVRLVNGSASCKGRVEVYLNGRWGTVCDDYFGIQEARVICRQLGMSAMAAYSRARYGRGTLPILLDDLQCTGNEAQIGFCRSTPVGEHNCGHSEDASVVCYVPA